MDLTLLARESDGLVLCEDQKRDGDFMGKSVHTLRAQATRLIESCKNGNNDEFVRTLVVDVDQDRKYKFAVTLGQDLIVLTLVSSHISQALALSFLKDIRTAFLEELRKQGGGTQVGGAQLLRQVTRPYHFIKFERAIQKRREKYQDPSNHESLKRLNQDLNQVTEIMRKNLNDLILRGENLEDVSRRADVLKNSSKKFAGAAKYLSRRAMLEKYAPFVILGLALVLLLLFVFR